MLQSPSNKAMVFVLSSPSGGGKSSISQKLLQDDSKLALSISATTRPPRSKEIDGIHYFFKDKAEFEKMINNGEMLEYAEIYNNLYGTPKSYVEDLLSKGFDILFDIDHHGAEKIKQELPTRCVSIFIMPPSLQVLRDRIEHRKQNTKEDIDLRMKFAEEEISHAPDYDYQVVNNDLEKSMQEIQAIIKKERALRN